MQTLPPTTSGLIAACAILLAIVLAAACGLGASSRVIGIQLPYVARDQSTWVHGHRASLWIVTPSCVTALVLALMPNDSLLGVGWLVWGVGIVGGGLAAMFKARRLARNAPH